MDGWMDEWMKRHELMTKLFCCDDYLNKGTHNLLSGEDATQRHSDHGQCASSPVVTLRVSAGRASQCRFAFPSLSGSGGGGGGGGSGALRPSSADIAPARSVVDGVPLRAGLHRAFKPFLQRHNSSANAAGQQSPGFSAAAAAAIAVTKSTTTTKVDFTLQCFDKFGNPCDSGEGAS